jgi:DNA-binding transcriptional MocR family regulator
MLPAYMQLATHLRGAIIVRQLPPGTPLPSEPELSERYKGSRVIVRTPQTHEQGELLGLTVFVVTEPGKRPVAYDTAQTVLAFPDNDPG